MKNNSKIDIIIESIFKKYPHYNSVRSIQRLQQIWPKIVGTVNSRNSMPQQLRDNDLIVYVKSSSWGFQLQFLKEEMKQRIFDTTDIKINDIQFKVRSSFRNKGNIYKRTTAQKDQWQKIDQQCLEEEDLRQIEKYAARMPDELRNQFKKIGSLFLKRHKYIIEQQTKE